MVTAEIFPSPSRYGAFALGTVFFVAVCLVCTPALVILLGAAAGMASPLFGAVLLLAFALGRAIPIMLGAWAVGWLESLSALAKYLEPSKSLVRSH